MNKLTTSAIAQVPIDQAPNFSGECSVRRKVEFMGLQRTQVGELQFTSVKNDFEGGINDEL